MTTMTVVFRMQAGPDCQLKMQGTASLTVSSQPEIAHAAEYKHTVITWIASLKATLILWYPPPQAFALSG